MKKLFSLFNVGNDVIYFDAPGGEKLFSLFNVGNDVIYFDAPDGYEFS